MTANDLAIADDPAYSRTPFVQAKSLAIGVELWPLIASRQLRVTGLTIDQPAIVADSVARAANGTSPSSAAPGPRPKRSAPTPRPRSKHGMDLSVKLVKITGGRFSLGKSERARQAAGAGRRQHRSPRFLRCAAPSRSRSPPKWRAAGASSWTAKLGPLDAVDVAASPLTATFNVDKLDLAGSGLLQSAPAIRRADRLPGGAAIRRQDGASTGQDEGGESEARQRRKRRQAAGGIRFHAGPQPAQPLGPTAPGRDQNWQRDGEPYRQLCRRGRNHRAQDEPGRSENGRARTGRDAAGDGDRAAQRALARRRHGQREGCAARARWSGW